MPGNLDKGQGGRDACLITLSPSLADHGTTPNFEYRRAWSYSERKGLRVHGLLNAALRLGMSACWLVGSSSLPSDPISRSERVVSARFKARRPLGDNMRDAAAAAAAGGHWTTGSRNAATNHSSIPSFSMPTNQLRVAQTRVGGRSDLCPRGRAMTPLTGHGAPTNMPEKTERNGKKDSGSERVEVIDGRLKWLCRHRQVSSCGHLRTSSQGIDSYQPLHLVC